MMCIVRGGRTDLFAPTVLAVLACDWVTDQWEPFKLLQVLCCFRVTSALVLLRMRRMTEHRSQSTAIPCSISASSRPCPITTSYTSCMPSPSSAPTDHATANQGAVRQAALSGLRSKASSTDVPSRHWSRSRMAAMLEDGVASTIANSWRGLGIKGAARYNS